jgi:hypothetical protein
MVLQNWQQGGTPEQWRQHDPEVVVQDFDWSDGFKLKRFEMLGPGDPRDANLYCQVRLTLESPKQVELNRIVTYVVGTDPVLTVFRDALQ